MDSSETEGVESTGAEGGSEPRKSLVSSSKLALFLEEDEEAAEEDEKVVTRCRIICFAAALAVLEVVAVLLEEEGWDWRWRPWAIWSTSLDRLLEED